MTLDNWEDETGLSGGFETEYLSHDESSDRGTLTENRFESVAVLEASPLLKSFFVFENGCQLSVLNNIVLDFPDRLIHRVEVSKTTETDIKLSITFTSPVIKASCSEHLIVIVCSDCTVHVHDHSGSLLSMPFVLSAACAKLSCRNLVVMVITCEMTVSVWDMKKKNALLVNCQLTSLFQSSLIHLKAAYVSETGQPVIVSSELKTYAYCSIFNAWVLLHEPSSKFADDKTDSTLSGLVIDENNNYTSLHFPYLTANELRKIDPSNSSVAQKLTQHSSLKHCQFAENLAAELGLSFEFQSWFLKCATKLGLVGFEDELRQKLDNLVIDAGPGSYDGGVLEPDDAISKLKVNRTQLLSKALANLSKNLHAQDVCNVYSKILKHLEQ